MFVNEKSTSIHLTSHQTALIKLVSMANMRIKLNSPPSASQPAAHKDAIEGWFKDCTEKNCGFMHHSETNHDEEHSLTHATCNRRYRSDSGNCDVQCGYQSVWQTRHISDSLYYVSQISSFNFLQCCWRTGRLWHAMALGQFGIVRFNKSHLRR